MFAALNGEAVRCNWLPKRDCYNKYLTDQLGYTQPTQTRTTTGWSEEQGTGDQGGPAKGAREKLAGMAQL